MTPPEMPEWKLGDTAEIRDGYMGANNHLTVLGPAILVGQWWVPILGDDGDPTFFKAAGLRKLGRDER